MEKVLLFLVVSCYLLFFHSTSSDPCILIGDFNEYFDETNASHHLYPYTATLVTITLLVVLVIIIATQGNRLNDLTQ
jgi:hypothetical protein